MNLKGHKQGLNGYGQQNNLWSPLTLATTISPMPPVAPSPSPEQPSPPNRCTTIRGRFNWEINGEGRRPDQGGRRRKLTILTNTWSGGDVVLGIILIVIRPFMLFLFLQIGNTLSLLGYIYSTLVWRKRGVSSLEPFLVCGLNFNSVSIFLSSYLLSFILSPFLSLI